MKTILVAAHELSTRGRPVNGLAGERIKVGPGTHITDAVRKKLGLDADDVERLIGTGAIVEVPVSVGTLETDDAVVDQLRSDLAAAERRATDAETERDKLKADLVKRPAAQA